MRITPFLTCFNYYGIFTGSTGSVIGAYDFNSGSGTALVYNILHPTGQNFSGNNFYGPALPMLNVGKSGAAGNMTGMGAFRIGYEVSGDFGLLIDATYDNCNRYVTGSGIGQVIVSNTSGSLTGFYIGIDEANQLYLSTSGYTKTLYSEIKPRNLIFVNLGNNNTIEFGYFDPHSNEIISESATVPVIQNTFNTLYLGGMLTYGLTTERITGFYGRLNNSILFNKPIGFAEASGCLECIFVTGSGTGTPSVSTVQMPVITGYVFSGVSETYINGYLPTTGQVLTANNTIVNVVFPSGVTGSRQGSEIATVLTGMSTMVITGEIPWLFSKGNEYNSLVAYTLQFKEGLVSGDTVEIYTFPRFNNFVNLIIEDQNFPSHSGFIQLIGNGLVETRDVDYIVQGNNVISGFYEDDSLRYDILTGRSIITAFSGWWARAKTLMSGGSFYPSSAQFNETIDTGRIIITGITGSRISRYSDVYLNGQKLVSGVHYNMIDDSVSGWFGSATGLNVVVLNPYFLPDYTGDFTYHPTGGPATGFNSIEDSELAFLPNYAVYTRSYVELTGTMTLTGVTGFSEQIWVNGVRQREGYEYVRNYPCLMTSGNIDEPELPFNFYNNDSGYFNIE
jgi:hypothetical protein